MSLIRSHILVCTGTGCTSSESPKIIAEFEKQLAAQGMDKEAQVVQHRLLRPVRPGAHRHHLPRGGLLHPRHRGRRGGDRVRAHRQGPHRQPPAPHGRGRGTSTVTSLAETQFYKHQLRIALRNCGVINPESIDEYIGVDGYAALEHSHRADRRPRRSSTCWTPACGAGAARASPPA